MDDSEFGLLENGWVGDDGKLIRNRGGQSKVNNSALTGCVEGIFDAGDDGSVVDLSLPKAGLIWFSGIGDTTNQGLEKILGYDGNALYEVINSLVYKVGGGSLIGTTLYLGTAGDGSPLPAEGLFSVVVDTAIANFFSGTARDAIAFTKMVKIGTDYFIGYPPDVKKWTGAVLSTDDTALGGTVVGLLGSEVLAFHSAVLTSNARRRSAGGVWSNLAIPVNANGNYIQPNEAATLGANLYIVGRATAGVAYNAIVYMYNGAALSLNKEFGFWNGGTDMTVQAYTFNSLLYVTYRVDAGVRLAKYTGAVWTDVEADFTALFPSDALGSIAGISAFNGSLYVLIRTTALDANGLGYIAKLYKSNGTTTTAWTLVLTTTIGVGGTAGVSGVGSHLFTIS